jgi:hypothetical protein
MQALLTDFPATFIVHDHCVLACEPIDHWHGSTQKPTPYVVIGYDPDILPVSLRCAKLGCPHRLSLEPDACHCLVQQLPAKRHRQDGQLRVCAESAARIPVGVFRHAFPLSARLHPAPTPGPTAPNITAVPTPTPVDLTPYGAYLSLRPPADHRLRRLTPLTCIYNAATLHAVCQCGHTLRGQRLADSANQWQGFRMLSASGQLLSLSQLLTSRRRMFGSTRTVTSAPAPKCRLPRLTTPTHAPAASYRPPSPALPPWDSPTSLPRSSVSAFRTTRRRYRLRRGASGFCLRLDGRVGTHKAALVSTLPLHVLARTMRSSISSITTRKRLTSAYGSHDPLRPTGASTRTRTWRATPRLSANAVPNSDTSALSERRQLFGHQNVPRFSSQCSHYVPAGFTWGRPVVAHPDIADNHADVSSAAAEIYAMGTATMDSDILALSCVCSEAGILFPRTLVLQVDNAAAQAFASQTTYSGKSRLRHVDARQEWIQVT